MDGKFFWTMVKATIKNQNTTQDWLASKIGMPIGTLKQQIHFNRLPDTVQSYRIAAALGVSVEYLITGAESVSKPDTSGVIQQVEKLLDDLKRL
jgi:transcriptional regulator with XRE-family HTH domain